MTRNEKAGLEFSYTDLDCRGVNSSWGDEKKDQDWNMPSGTGGWQRKTYIDLGNMGTWKHLWLLLLVGNAMLLHFIYLYAASDAQGSQGTHT